MLRKSLVKTLKRKLVAESQTDRAYSHRCASHQTTIASDHHVHLALAEAFATYLIL
jgi:hypothetical protein